MENTSVIVKLFADCMNCDIEKMEENFSVRMELQKKIYLIQELNGIDLGFNYAWYLRGPYCPAVADAGFFIIRNKEKFSSGKLKLKESIKQQTFKFFSACDKKCPTDLELVLWYELLASVHYIEKNLCSERPSKNKTIQKLIEKKDWYTKKQAECAYEFIFNTWRTVL